MNINDTYALIFPYLAGCNCSFLEHKKLICAFLFYKFSRVNKRSKIIIKDSFESHICILFNYCSAAAVL